MSKLCRDSIKTLKHPRNSQIRFENRSFWVKEGQAWHRLRGIHRAIKGIFFDPIEQSHLRRPASKKSVAGRSDNSFNSTAYATGIEGGDQIHKEIEIYCNERVEWDRRVEITIDYLKRKKAAKASNRRLPLKPAAMLHPCSVNAITELKAKNLEPIVGEFAIFSPGVYATKIDIVCVHTISKTIVLVELKSGYVDTFRQWEAPMKGLLRNYLSNSELSRAVLQVFIPMCTLKYEYGISSAAVVLHVNKEGATITPLPTALVKEAPILYPWIKSEIIKKS